MSSFIYCFKRLARKICMRKAVFPARKHDSEIQRQVYKVRDCNERILNQHFQVKPSNGVNFFLNFSVR